MRAVAAVATLAAALVCGGVGSAGTIGPPGPRLLAAGAAGVAFGGGIHRSSLSPDASGMFLPGTSLLASPEVFPPTIRAGYSRLLRGPLGVPDPVVGVDEAGPSRDWLAAGTVPGRTDAERDVATRALLDLALLTGTDGATVASPFGPWDLVWPRDASWHAAAFAATGHPEQARAILGFLARAQAEDGTWAPRYFPNGEAITDSRPRQLDAVGWVPWAAWSWWQADQDLESLRTLWPMIHAAAEAAAASLDVSGLPRPSSDYWEQRESRPTIGTAAPLLLGLRAAADLARALDETGPAQTWAAAARRLDAAIAATFGATGFRRYPYAEAGPDSALTFLAAPLATPRNVGPAILTRAVTRAEGDLLMPSGGLRPGDIPRVGGVAWTPATALFALAAAGRGDEADFARWFGWLSAHRTAVGAFPEKVTNAGAPASVAPLGWTCAIVLLALVARDGGVPSPPG